MSEKWDYRFLEQACLTASWSKDPIKQVGCVLIDEQRRIVSTGYNGPPRDVEIPEPDGLETLYGKDNLFAPPWGQSIRYKGIDNGTSLNKSRFPVPGHGIVPF